MSAILVNIELKVSILSYRPFPKKIVETFLVLQDLSYIFSVPKF